MRFLHRVLYDVSGVQFSRRLVLGVVRGFYDGLSGLYADINFHIPASKMFNDLEVGSLTGIPQSRPFGVNPKPFLGLLGAHGGFEGSTYVTYGWLSKLGSLFGYPKYYVPY